MKVVYTLSFIFLTLLSVSFTMAMKKKNSEVLRQRIDSVLDSAHGTFAIAFKDLQSDLQVYINERENFHAASTMKTPVMVELFKQAQEHKFSLTDSISIANSFKSIVDGSEYSLTLSDDSDDELYSSLSTKQSLRSLIVKMITVSSNLATNILIEKVGARNVMTTMKELGLHDIQVLRGVEDGKAFAAGKNNTTTAYDFALLFESIAIKKCISADASEEMIAILLDQKFNDMIPAKLPSGVAVAHKTGSITNVQHDSGIIFLPDGRVYVLVILSKNLKSNSDGINTIAKISKLIYDFVTE